MFLPQRGGPDRWPVLRLLPPITLHYFTLCVSFLFDTTLLHAYLLSFSPFTM